MRANLVFVLVILFLSVETVAAQGYKAVELPTLGGTETVTTSISPSGLVAGYSKTADGATHPYIYDYDDGTGESTMIDLGVFPGSAWGKALGINDLKHVVGFCRTESAADHAFLYKDGAMTDIGVFGSTTSRAVGINARGDAIVQYNGGLSVSGSFIYNNGTVTSLGSSVANAINNPGQVVGRYCFDDVNTTAFLYDGESMINLGGLGGDFTQSEAYSINNSGQIVGASWNVLNQWNSNIITHAFLYDNGVMTDLGTLGGSYSYAMNINNNGDIVGYSETATGEQRGFLWQEGIGMQDLSTLAGMGIGDAAAISDSGWIADAGGSGAYLLIPIVPEPSTLALLIIGSIFFVAYLWRHRKT